MLDNEIVAVPCLRAALTTGIVTFEVADNYADTAAFATAISSGPMPGPVTVKEKKLAPPAPDRARMIRASLPTFTGQAAAGWGAATSVDGNTVVYSKATKETAATEAISMLPTTAMYVLDYSKTTETKLDTGRYPSEGALVSGDGKTVVFLTLRKDTDGNGKIDVRDYYSVMCYQGGKETELVPTESKVRTYILAPDGRHIGFSSLRTDTNGDGKTDELDHASLFTQMVGTKTPVAIGDPKDSDSWPINFTRDGKKLLYASWQHDTNGDGQIDKLDNYGFYLVDAAGGTPTVLIPDKYAADFLVFVPDSPDFIFTMAMKDTDGDGSVTYKDKRVLYRVTPDGTMTRLSEEGAAAIFGRVSKDGKSILYWKPDTNGAALMLAPTTGGEVKEIAAASATVVSFGLSMESTKLAYTTADYGTAEAGAPPKSYIVREYDLVTRDASQVREGLEFPLFVSYLPGGEKMLMWVVKTDTNDDGKTDTADRPQLIIFDRTATPATDTAILTDKLDCALLGGSPRLDKLIVSIRDADTNKDGKIDSADEPTTYLIDLGGKKLLTLYGG